VDDAARLLPSRFRLMTGSRSPAPGVRRSPVLKRPLDPEPADSVMGDAPNVPETSSR